MDDYFVQRVRVLSELGWARVVEFVVRVAGWPYRIGHVVRGGELGLKVARDFCNALPCCLDEFFSLKVHATE